MNNKVNYFIIGILVIIGIAAMSLFGFWLLKPTDESEVKRYIIYFNESVLGLNLDAPVKYRGLSVGKVIKLSISKSHNEQVEVLVEVLKETPIKTSTVAQLTSQGITGLSYINLTFSECEEEEILKAKDDEEYPVIKSVPSFLIKIENRFIDISESLADTLQRIQELLKKDNQQDVSMLLKKSNNFIDKINTLLDDNTLESFKQTLENLNGASRQLDEVMPKLVKLIEKTGKSEDDIVASFKSIKNSYADIQESIATFKDTLNSGEFNIKEISNELIYNMNETLFEIRMLTLKSKEVIQKYENSPADMLFVKEEAKKGPGEE